MTAMDRRTFSRSAAGLAGALALAGTGVPERARAQRSAPVEGVDFRALDRPITVPANGKIEVIEFFWYACPHCFAFEPALEEWAHRLPADVHFSRVPVGFDARKETHQRIYYTWEALGLVEKMHLMTFLRFHLKHRPIENLRDMQEFAQENGLDVGKVGQAWDSFTVQTRCREARRLEDDYGIEHMPEIAIAGRFVAVTRPGVLATTDWLINRIRRGA